MKSPARGRALICGSLAYDTIMVFGDRFANHILPDKIHMLSVSFLVPQLRREYGGCAGNIAYNLALLGDAGYPMATVGRDFGPYREWMRKCGVPVDHVRTVDSELTAQAFITTDIDDNQITAFHPGAMQHSHLNQVADAGEVAIGIVAPDGREGMIRHAEQFAAAGIPFIFDPGQGLPMFGGEELERFVAQATWVTLNDYEWQLVQQKTGWTAGELVRRVAALIVTHGAGGST
ncbi:MAG TPA: carbohydrate kinase family protein, partial [Steroidobacteraceae bacterium]|nr:carbohydrate kinase family protein [Steroidobacteraceae bacterium]